MNEREDIMINYLSGNLSSSEKKKFESELQNSDQLRKEFINYSEIWELSGSLRYPESQTDYGWEDFKATVKAPEKKLGFDWLKVAASILILAAFSVATYTFINGRDHSYSTDDQIKTFELKDQTLIVLNDHSVLTQAPGYGKSNRNMYLDGEAAFNVEKSDIPFLLEVHSGFIRVLGTEFNVISDKQNGYLEVELYTGSLRFESSLGDIRELVPGQRLISFNGDVQINDIPHTQASWLDNQEYISCRDVPLKHIMVQIARTYEVDYKIPKQKLNEHYTVVLPKNDLEDCLRILSKISNLQFIVDDNLIRVQ